MNIIIYTLQMPPKRIQRSLQEKYEIISAYEKVKNERGAKTKVMKTFNLPTLSSLNSILSLEKDIKLQYFSNFPTDRNKIRHGKFPLLDDQLYSWFKQMRANEIELTGDMILEQAKILAVSLDYIDFKGSQGFLEKFKSRYGIKFRKFYGQGRSVDDTVVDDWLTKLPDILSNFEPKDIYNWDETALFFAQTKNASLVTENEHKNKDARGKKPEKQRVTLLLGASMEGEKLPPIIIGKHQSPRGFANARIPLDYHHSKSAWMTSEIFEKILTRFDRSMKVQGRKVLLFIDNCSAHKKPHQLQNVTLHFFPPNITSRCQPLDMGVIAAFKNHYKSELQKRRVQALNVGLEVTKINLFDSLFLVKKIWNSNVSVQTIKNCFRKAGFIMTQDELFELEVISDTDELPLPLVYNDDLERTSAPTFEESPQPQVIEDLSEENDNCDEDNGEPVLDDKSSYEAINKLSLYFARLGENEFHNQLEKMKDFSYKLIMSKKVQSEITDYFR